MKNHLQFSLLAGSLLLLWSPLRAQESLAGIGAASSIGAGIGAAAAGGAVSSGRATRNVGQTQTELINEAGAGGAAAPGAANLAQNGLAVTPVTITNAPIPQTFGVDSREVVGKLRQTPTARRVVPGRLRKTGSKRTRDARIARLSPAQRKRAVAQRYKIPPRGWLAAYLPQDRYKFGKNWSVVSTEDSRYYYAPQVLAARRFNPNRVIGFRTWQDAMQAGYQPDPVSKPAPAAQVARLAGQTRGENFYRYVDYLYAGQISPTSFAATYAYSQRVASQINRYAYAKPYLGSTMDKVFQAAIEGNPSVIPTYIGRRVVVANAAEGGAAVTGAGAPNLPNQPGAPGAGEPATGGGNREEDFNRFRGNAGNLANVPANR